MKFQIFRGFEWEDETEEHIMTIQENNYIDVEAILKDLSRGIKIQYPGGSIRAIQQLTEEIF